MYVHIRVYKSKMEFVTIVSYNVREYNQRQEHCEVTISLKTST